MRHLFPLSLFCSGRAKRLAPPETGNLIPSARAVQPVVCDYLVEGKRHLQQHHLEVSPSELNTNALPLSKPAEDGTLAFPSTSRIAMQVHVQKD